MGRVRVGGPPRQPRKRAGGAAPPARALPGRGTPPPPGARRRRRHEGSEGGGGGGGGGGGRHRGSGGRLPAAGRLPTVGRGGRTGRAAPSRRRCRCRGAGGATPRPRPAHRRRPRAAAGRSAAADAGRPAALAPSGSPPPHPPTPPRRVYGGPLPRHRHARCPPRSLTAHRRTGTPARPPPPPPPTGVRRPVPPLRPSPPRPPPPLCCCRRCRPPPPLAAAAWLPHAAHHKTVGVGGTPRWRGQRLGAALRSSLAVPAPPAPPPIPPSPLPSRPRRPPRLEPHGAATAGGGRAPRGAAPGWGTHLCWSPHLYPFHSRDGRRGIGRAGWHGRPRRNAAAAARAAVAAVRRDAGPDGGVPKRAVGSPWSQRRRLVADTARGTGGQVLDPPRRWGWPAPPLGSTADAAANTTSVANGNKYSLAFRT
ncbi:hypothetical protein BU14_0055s0049, partial [Porphyra umbilicalis]